jgi:energy-coupling factor transporter ATP-binding protein EcfA2
LWLVGQLEQGRNGVAVLLGHLGLARHGDRLPAEVSLGERQRVALARAMVVRPRLLLADEPTAHQDADWAAAMLDAVRDLAAQGSCCVVATHSEEFLPRVDRVLTISDGQLRSESTPADDHMCRLALASGHLSRGSHRIDARNARGDRGCLDRSTPSRRCLIDKDYHGQIRGQIQLDRLSAVWLWLVD